MTERKTEKASGRTSTLLTATICWAGNEAPAFIRNISEMGALVETEAIISPDEQVSLKRDSLKVDGQIAWAREQTYGIRFASVIDTPAWIGEITKTPVINVQSSLKKMVEEGVDVSPIIDKRISEEIYYITRMLQGIGDVLSKDAILCTRHSIQMQNISIATQMLLEIGTILSSSDKFAALDTSVTGPMKSRILR